MSEKRIGILMHGITGRMGMNQHLIRSILEIRKQGGVALKDGTRVMPDPLLVGRNAAKVEELARQHGVHRWTTDRHVARSRASFLLIPGEAPGGASFAFSSSSSSSFPHFPPELTRVGPSGLNGILN